MNFDFSSLAKNKNIIIPLVVMLIIFGGSYFGVKTLSDSIPVQTQTTVPTVPTTIPTTVPTTVPTTEATKPTTQPTTAPTTAPTKATESTTTTDGTVDNGNGPLPSDATGAAGANGAGGSAGDQSRGRRMPGGK